MIGRAPARSPKQAATRPQDRRRLMLVLGVAGVASLAYGGALGAGASAQPGIVMPLMAVLSFTAFLAEAGAFVFVSRRMLDRRLAAWRCMVVGSAAFLLEAAQHLVLKREPFAVEAAAWVAECFVVAVLAQPILGVRLGRSLVIAFLAKVLATMILLAMAGVVAAILAAAVLHAASRHGAGGRLGY